MATFSFNDAMQRAVSINFDPTTYYFSDRITFIGDESPPVTFSLEYNSLVPDEGPRLFDD